MDGFKRPWPNPVVSSQHTIEEVDKMWEALGIGEKLISPSLKYQKYVNNNAADVK